MDYDYLFAIGQDSHRFRSYQENEFAPEGVQKLGGVMIQEAPLLEANSDGDVLLHALTNAISGITGVNILGAKADEMCLSQGITDSAEYLKEALNHLHGSEIIHVSFSVECKTPKLASYIYDIRLGVSVLLGIPVESVALTATSGEGLSAYGRGEGIMAICAITVRKAREV